MARGFSRFTLAGSMLCLASATFLRADSLACNPKVTNGFFVCFVQAGGAYTATTTLIDVSGTTDGTAYSSLPVPPGSGLKVSFNSGMVRQTVPGSWGTWNCPPATEASCGDMLTPANSPVFWSNGATTITMTLSMAEGTFGFEAQPDLSDVEKMTATFFDAAGNKVGSISGNVSGNGGALLFAASSNDPFKTVTLTDSGPVPMCTGSTCSAGGCPAGAVCDFAIANLRYNSASIPEPPPALLVGIVLAGIVGWKVRLSR
jgi:hypothetical protein